MTARRVVTCNKAHPRISCEIMSSKSKRHMCMFGLLFALVVVVSSCGGTPEEEDGVAEPVVDTYTSVYDKVCDLGFYDVFCWTVALRDPTIEYTLTFDDPSSSLPNEYEDRLGEVKNIVAEGTFKAKSELKVSPLIPFGVPPPFCAAKDPETTFTGATVGEFKLTGNLKYEFGESWNEEDYDGFDGHANHSRIVLVENNLRFEKFEIKGIPDKGDQAVKQLSKNTIMRKIDQLAVQKINDLLCLCDAPDNLPVYSSKINNDHSEGGFCEESQNDNLELECVEYPTTDGCCFANRAVAEAHQAELDGDSAWLQAHGYVKTDHHYNDEKCYPLKEWEPADRDSDGDGLSDYFELNFYTLDPSNPDIDGDGLLDGYEFEIGTWYGSRDTDYDGWEDKIEDDWWRSLSPDEQSQALSNGLGCGPVNFYAHQTPPHAAACKYLAPPSE